MLGLFVSLLVSAPAAAVSADQSAPPPAASQPAASQPVVPARHGKRVPPVLPAEPSPLRRLMQAQLDMPPRNDGADGLSAPEADAVMAHYLASIGKPLDPAPQQQGSRP
jgi:hypothetical protein